MAKRSAGVLLYRHAAGGLEVLLVHPGGPFWARKDAGAWSIPKGEADNAEDLRATAAREFEEELGVTLPGEGRLLDLGEVKQKSGKIVTAFALEHDLDADAVSSNTFTIEWPPRSGETREFPEIDRAGWFGPEEAREKLVPAQAEFVDRLLERIS
jgi:predicted NUDIX family NTP pyrophosphohydrolase